MDVLALLLGIAAAVVGGEWFVRGAVGLAAWARVPAAVIGTTVAAFATSSPELSVGIQAATSGTPEIALGDALGSNVINVALVLGVTVAMGPLVVDRGVRRELAVAALAPVLTLAVLVDGRLGRGEAAVLLAVFVAWLVVVVRDALRRREAVADDDEQPVGRGRAIAFGVAGLVALVIAGRLIVSGGTSIGEALGLDPFVVGATIVAFGTSTPELATAVIARLRGHVSVGVGTVLGSNVFNNLWIVGVVALIQPIRTEASEVLLAVGACLVALALVVPRGGDVLGRGRGVALLGVAAAYSVATLLVGH